MFMVRRSRNSYEPQDLLVFDIETIPDIDCCYELTGIKPYSDEHAVQLIYDYHEQSSGNSFPRQPFHKIVVLSILHAKNQGEYFKVEKISSASLEEKSEREIIDNFFQIFKEGFLPIIVTYNGKIFDIPVLKYRAMKHFVQSREFYCSGDKWNSYNQRYSMDWHCDLLEVLSDYGSASKNVKMHEICTMLNIPGKIGVDGSQVSGLFFQSEWEKLRNYCESDVISTYLIYLRLMHTRGNLVDEMYNKSIDSILFYLKNNTSNNKHYIKYLEEWALSCDHQFMISCK